MEKIQIIGYVGKDAEIKSFNGVNYTSFNVAITNKNKQSGTEETNWYSCLRHGDNVAPYIKKGTKVYVSGAFKITVKEGNVFRNVNVSDLEFMSRPNDQTQTDKTEPTEPATQLPPNVELLKEQLDSLPF